MGIINYAPKILDPIPGGKYVVNAIDYVVNWARANSIWPLTYGTSCCAIEMMSSSMARYDIARFGSEVFRSSLSFYAGNIFSGNAVCFYAFAFWLSKFQRI